jgi:hypothetical protein
MGLRVERMEERGENILRRWHPEDYGLLALRPVINMKKLTFSSGGPSPCRLRTGGWRRLLLWRRLSPSQALLCTHSVVVVRRKAMRAEL